jgi:ribonuclease HI
MLEEKSKNKQNKINDINLLILPELSEYYFNKSKSISEYYTNSDSNIRDKFSIETNVDRTILYSIGSLFEETLPEGVSLEQLCSYGFRIEINREIDDLELGIIYSDGSINPETKVGGFGVVKICENNSEDLIFDDFSNRLRHYEEYSGTVDNSTNNISELIGFKLALQNMDDTKKYWVIISDSDLSVKSFRDYLYEWRNNGYKKANTNKPILNCELIKEIDDMVLKSDRIIFYKWIESHSKKECNERCDILAKTACGVI